MTMLFRNLLEPGYYEEDEDGDLTKIDDPVAILEARRQGCLYENDGFATTKVYDDQDLDL